MNKDKQTSNGVLVIDLVLPREEALAVLGLLKACADDSKGVPRELFRHIDIAIFLIERAIEQADAQ